ncbi:HDOD domain-containing protein [Leeia oryzae]|uniref:HDOD domain-containing protein n=1 Tax=Leeia oryzae TaxID=356662 RepID=UPI0003785785|nr:HDOD domain-containing protein [Leeia oryzae]
MLKESLPNLHAWVLYLENFQIPILPKTAEALQSMAPDADHVTAKLLSDAILHDPFMTVKVIRHLQERRSNSQRSEITTVAHAIMMLGVIPFFRNFQNQPTLDNALANYPEARAGINNVLIRARLAATFASAWAKVRHDLESDELIIAALLHDISEMLLWCSAPDLAWQINTQLKRNPGMRSHVAQKAVLGFTLQELQLQLSQAWHLPGMLTHLMDEKQDQKSPRTHIAILATRLARHISNGWDDPALPDDYQEVATLLNMDVQLVKPYLEKLSIKVSTEIDWYTA